MKNKKIMVDLLDEIKEDIKKQELETLWKRYGTWVIGTITAIILTTGATVWFKHHQKNTQEAFGNTYLETVQQIKIDRHPQNIELLKEISQSDSPFGPIATIKQASLYLLQKDPELANESFKRLMQDSKTPEVFREYAQLHTINYALNTQESLDTTQQQTLNFLARQNGPWYLSALELQIAHAIKQGDHTTAHTIAAQINDTPNTPISQRIRVQKTVQNIKETTNDHATNH